jgi:hypothetical protein
MVKDRGEVLEMVRVLFEIWAGHHIRIAELDAENTDNTRAVVVQYMQENGMSFDILGEGKDADGNDTLTVYDEDGRVSVYFVGTVYGSEVVS